MRAIVRLAAPAGVVVALQPTIATTTKPLTEDEQDMVRTKEIHVRSYVEHVRETYTAMEAGLGGARVPVIDLGEAFGNQPELFFADECHFGDEAAERVAQRIADYLSDQL